MANIVNVDFDKNLNNELLEFNSADRYLGRLAIKEKIIINRSLEKH
jgi:hypothetical protein